MKIGGRGGEQKAGGRRMGSRRWRVRGQLLTESLYHL